MNPDLLEPLFGALAILILPFWVLVVFLPSWGVTRRVVRSLWSVVPIACAYTALVVPQLAVVLPLLFSADPLGQAAYFSTPEGYLVISAHAVSLDLFVGRWVYLDGYDAGLSPWLMSPVLLLVMFLGPLGLLVYLAARRARPAA